MKKTEKISYDIKQVEGIVIKDVELLYTKKGHSKASFTIRLPQEPYEAVIIGVKGLLADCCAKYLKSGMGRRYLKNRLQNQLNF